MQQQLKVTKSSGSRPSTARLLTTLLLGGLLVLTLQTAGHAAALHQQSTPTVEPAEEAAQATEAPAEEATPQATEAPAEEATPQATEMPAEEVTPQATEEATPEATEEAAEEATPQATEEAAEEATPQATEEAAEEMSEEEMLDQGAELFTNYCAACHQADGRGIPDAYPSLAGSPLVTAEDPTSVLRIIFTGRAGMPHFRNAFSNVEIAAIVSFIRNSWDNDASFVSAEEVSTVEEEIYSPSEPMEHKGDSQ